MLYIGYRFIKPEVWTGNRFRFTVSVPPLLNNTKTQNKPSYFLDFIYLIKDKIELLKIISALNN